MNGCIESIIILLKELCQELQKDIAAECVLIPPAIYLPLVSSYISSWPSDCLIRWGAQNIYPKEAGAFTGELSAPMLKDYHCDYVLVGHSERRILFAENEKFVADKFHHVKEHDMMPILCVGETLYEREQGRTEEVIERQLRAVAEHNSNRSRDCFECAVIAYEPVWAIGTGYTASPEQVQTVHLMIRALLAEFSKEHKADTPLLYGGSVNATNAQALFAMPDVDGGLIGGASLSARQFVDIVKCIN